MNIREFTPSQSDRYREVATLLSLVSECSLTATDCPLLAEQLGDVIVLAKKLVRKAATLRDDLRAREDEDDYDYQ